MVQSMTGFGNASFQTETHLIVVDLRSLNSKTLDLTLRLPKFLTEKEHEIKQLIGRSLSRGKINGTIEIQALAQTKAPALLNQELFIAYYRQLEQLAEAVAAPKNDLFRLAFGMPDVMQFNAAEQPADVSWEQVLPVLHEAIFQLNHFRTDEGKALSQEIVSYIERIRILLSEIDKHDPNRIQHIRQRLQNHLAELQQHSNIDQNRFEQEMLYYIEKLDIAEEKVRLLNHLHYFTESLYTEDAPGKKLAFVAQEIGREINTIGSKANDHVVQHKVVEMKEELEKIKEQLHNIL